MAYRVLKSLRPIGLAGLCWLGWLPLMGQRQVLHSRQEWMQLNLLFGREDRTGFRFDASTRHVQDHPGLSQYLLRGGVTYRLSPGLAAVSGLAAIRYYDDGSASRLEWRPYQDLSRSLGAGRTRLEHRLRLEPRFLRDLPGGLPGEWTFQFRMRYRLQAQWTLAEISHGQGGRALLLTLGDEVMVNPVHSRTASFFGTNRMLVSPTLRWGPRLDMALTYNHQFSARTRPDDFESAEVVWLNITGRIATDGRQRKRRG
jgi:hypothetical protein